MSSHTGSDYGQYIMYNTVNQGDNLKSKLVDSLSLVESLLNAKMRHIMSLLCFLNHS